MSSPTERKIRVLVAKPGLDGHDRGAKVIAATLRDRGMEVIYTGLHQTPEMIAEAAVQEDVDVVGLSVLSGAHMTLFPKIKRLLEERGMSQVLLTGGGIIPKEDMEALKEAGFGKLFGPGTPTGVIADYIEEEVKKRRAAANLPPSSRGGTPGSAGRPSSKSAASQPMPPARRPKAAKPSKGKKSRPSGRPYR